jgi:hypothetical protein
VDRNAAAILTYADVDAKCTGFAVPDVISHFSLSYGKFMSSLILRIKTIEYILNCTFVPHDSPPCGSSKGLRMPRRLLLLTWIYTSVDLGSMWPSSAWIYLMSTPFSNR